MGSLAMGLSTPELPALRLGCESRGSDWMATLCPSTTPMLMELPPSSRFSESRTMRSTSDVVSRRDFTAVGSAPLPVSGAEVAKLRFMRCESIRMRRGDGPSRDLPLAESTGLGVGGRETYGLMGLSDRAFEVWEPLVRVNRVLGGKSRVSLGGHELSPEAKGDML